MPFSSNFQQYQDDKLKNIAEIEVIVAPGSNNPELCRTIKCKNEQASGFCAFKDPSYYAVGYVIFVSSTGTVGYEITDIFGWNTDLFRITQIIGLKI